MNWEDMAFVALGSNLGDSPRAVLSAMDLLQALSKTPVLRSSLWETTPVDCPPGSPPFINAVVGLAPLVAESPESLLRKLKALEEEFGRTQKQVPNEPRPLDLDLITFAREVRNSTTLTLPHPRARERRFVLQPLNEIAPGLVLPGESKTVNDLLARLAPDAAMKKA